MFNRFVQTKVQVAGGDKPVRYQIDYSNKTNFVRLNTDGTKTLFPRRLFEEIPIQDEPEYVIHGNEIFLGEDNERGLVRRRLIAKVYSGFSFEKLTGINGGFRIVKSNFPTYSRHW